MAAWWRRRRATREDVADPERQLPSRTRASGASSSPLTLSSVTRTGAPPSTRITHLDAPSPCGHDLTSSTLRVVVAAVPVVGLDAPPIDRERVGVEPLSRSRRDEPVTPPGAAAARLRRELRAMSSASERLHAVELEAS